MTPAEAERWAWQASRWVCSATPGEGWCQTLSFLADSLARRYRLGEHHEALQLARQRLAEALCWRDQAQNRGYVRQTRLLLIFVRRLTRHVGGYVPPQCGWCSDTGIEHYRSGRDVWPIACHACHPEQHEEQLPFRLRNKWAANRAYWQAVAEEGELWQEDDEP